jgi:hypothetical protein
MTTPEPITLTLPNPEDFAEELALIDRLSMAVDLAGELTSEEFAAWCECAATIKQRREVIA